MEEKRQISSLPPPSMNDQRSGGPNSRQPAGQQQTKKGDWNTVQSNKSSRFAIKKPDQVILFNIFPGITNKDSESNWQHAIN